MRKVFLFIRQFFNLFFFIILQVFCWTLLVNSNETHHGLFASAATEVKGKIDEQYNNIEYYFRLRAANHRLAEQNAILMAALMQQYSSIDSSKQLFVDSLLRDTAGKYNVIDVLPARVVGNTVSEELNYITLKRGGRQGAKRDMAVIGPKGIIGKVIDTSANFCRVMSLLNRNTRVSGMLKKNNYSGVVTWDGEDPNELVFQNVSRTAAPKIGDTVVTSYYSGSFPPNLLVGYVTKVKSDPTTNFLTVKLRPSVNFYTIQHAFLVDNRHYAEQKELENKPLKQ